ncbi:angiotensin-converting enzyme-like [Anneissia japonica]|uniref:angiotensin-converting enzyme-like n=1 Tax=Anneissia japonica TaxID=1529436 RepID=UPI0014257AA6|nr:angiotensin-converting enzyme-like [Anneissia japonica]
MKLTYRIKLQFSFAIVYFSVCLTLGDLSSNVQEAEDFLKYYENHVSDVYFPQISASWDYYTNITDENLQKSVDADVASTGFVIEAYKNASRFDTSTFSSDMQRQIAFIKDIGNYALAVEDEDKYRKLADIIATMNGNYGSGEVCKTDGECLPLEPDLEEIMAKSQDWDERVWAWQGWRDAVGRANRPLYIDYVDLKNEAARIAGYADTGDQWRAHYESDTIVQDAKQLYQDILPLYKQLHAYVRRKLKTVYGDKVDLKSALPSNILGDMWGRFWGEIYDVVEPYPDATSVDVTPQLVEQGYTVCDMFNLSDSFFTSLGLKPMPQPFWNKSMLTKPTDGRTVVCHPSAWDFSNRIDFRIKMCTEVHMSHLLTIHHEMGHIEYDLQYADQPYVYHDGANGAFHEAVGEIMSLSVATPAHLKKIGLLDIQDTDYETDINFLLKQSLDVIGTLPFSYMIDQWRWGVFAGEILPEKYTDEWWKMKMDLVGVVPPVPREVQDLDATALLHIVYDYPFLRFLFSLFCILTKAISFQFYEAMCNAANHTGPLYKCDFYESKEAGQLLGNMLALGRSKPWPEAMEAITGQREMSAEPLLRYFESLNH